MFWETYLSFIDKISKTNTSTSCRWSSLELILTMMSTIPQCNARHVLFEAVHSHIHIDIVYYCSHLRIVELRLSDNPFSSTDFLSCTKDTPTPLSNELKTLYIERNQQLAINGAVRSSHFSCLTKLRKIDANDVGFTNLDFLMDSNNNNHLTKLEVRRFLRRFRKPSFQLRVAFYLGAWVK